MLYLGKDIPLRNLPWFENDVVVGIYGKELRVFRSENPTRGLASAKRRRWEEPWYLLTNDSTSTKDGIVADYYFRFEIEETFKDLKYIVELKKFYTIKKKQTFLILLWFYILHIWMAFLLTREYITKRVGQNKHKLLSIVRFFFEQIQFAKYSYAKLHVNPSGG